MSALPEMSEIPKEERVGYTMQKEMKDQLQRKINDNFNGMLTYNN